MSAAGVQYAAAEQPSGGESLASVLGLTALVAGVIALITASTVALAVLVAGHACAVAGGNGAACVHAAARGSRDAHEVLDPQKPWH